MKPDELLEQLLPATRRWLTTDAPETVEVLLREKGGEKTLHLVNLAPGQRKRDPKAPEFLSLHLNKRRRRWRAGSRCACPGNRFPSGFSRRTNRSPIGPGAISPLPSFESHQMAVISTTGSKP